MPDQTTDAESAEKTVREHVTTLHLIGEQLDQVENWMWQHLADTRDAADPSEAHRLALSEVLGLGTGAPWDAIRERAAELAAVSSVGQAPTPNRTALRDRIRRVLCERDGQAALWGTDMLEPDEYGADADAVLAVLPEPADRTAVLLWAAEHLLARCPHLGKADALRKCTCPAAEELLRLASQEPGAPDYAEAREELLRRLAADPAAVVSGRAADETRDGQPDVCGTCYAALCVTCHACRCDREADWPCRQPHCPAGAFTQQQRVQHSGPHAKFCVLCLSGEHDRVDDVPAVGGAQQPTEA
jgi:hypothetical protein